jgi:guanylate kinase
MLLILCGKTSSGKNTYREALLRRNPSWYRAVSHTTRPMREGEENHLQYHFVEKNKFITMAIQNFFIETTEYSLSDYSDDKWYYGLTKAEVDSNILTVAILNQSGVKKAIEYLGKKNVYVVYLHAENEEIRRRGHERMDDPIRFEMRLRDDIIQFEGIEKIADLTINTECTAEEQECNYGIIEKLLESEMNV